MLYFLKHLRPLVKQYHYVLDPWENVRGILLDLWTLSLGRIIIKELMIHIRKLYHLIGRCLLNKNKELLN